MNGMTVAFGLLIAIGSVGIAPAQQRLRVDVCCLPPPLAQVEQPPWPPNYATVSNIFLDPLREELTLDDSQLEALTETEAGDRFEQVIRATVRVTVSGVCGSGTIVGRAQDGCAIVLTNAHVAGTSRGRVVNLERWNPDGTSERGTGAIIAAGYGRGSSVDFALLKCNGEFARGVRPIPLADRYPNPQVGVTTYGSPRCEWPSLQVLRLNRKEGQILSWRPEAIGGRSGSGVIDYTDDGPRVVGLLTWAGGGEGLGQSTPFLLSAMRGRLPATLEALPPGVREVSCLADDPSSLFEVPASTKGEPYRWPLRLLAQAPIQDDLLDSITARPVPQPNPTEPQLPPPGQPPSDPSLPPDLSWTAGQLIATSAASSILLLLGLQYGLPLLLQALRELRKNRGNSLLTDDQFQQLLDQYRNLLKLMEQNATIAASHNQPPEESQAETIHAVPGP